LGVWGADVTLREAIDTLDFGISCVAEPDRKPLRKALASLEEQLQTTERERDAILAAVAAEPPDDPAVRYFQRLHGLPEVGLIGDAAEVQRLKEQLEAAQRVIDAARLVVEKRAVYVGIPMADGRPSGRVTYPLDDALAAYDASFGARA
jgi:hypothetical protein